MARSAWYPSSQALSRGPGLSGVPVVTDIGLLPNPILSLRQNGSLVCLMLLFERSEPLRRAVVAFIPDHEGRCAHGVDYEWLADGPCWLVV